MRNIEKYNGKILEQTYLQDCTLIIKTDLEKADAFQKSFEPYNEIKIKLLNDKNHAL